MLRYIWVVLLVATAMAQETAIPTGFVYRISTDRSKYIHGEEIIVTSVLSNASDRVQEVRVPHGFTRSETCLLFPLDSGRTERDPRGERPDSDEQLMIRLVPGEAYTNTFSLADFTTSPWFELFSDTHHILPIGMWRITAIYHFESRTNNLHYDRVLRSAPLLIQIVKPEENEKNEYDEFINVLKIDKREERLDKLRKYIDEHARGRFVRSAIRALADYTSDVPELRLVVARLAQQTAISIVDRDIATWELCYYLKKGGQRKEALELIDNSMAKRQVWARELRDERMKASGGNDGSGKKLEPSSGAAK